MKTRQSERNRLTRCAQIALLGGALFAGAMAEPVSAGVDNPTIVNGDVTIAQNGNLTTITASDGSIINFTGLGVDAHEVLQFIQPGDLARVLNRITGPDPTIIAGTLLANGQVYIVNPSGVYFTNGSVTDVAGLYAAAGDMSNTRFLRGVDKFSNLRGEVVNEGTLKADQIHMVGQHVANHGLIRTDRGIVTMVAGDEVLIRQHGDRVTVKVDGSWLNTNNGPNQGQTAPDMDAQAGVQNTGTIRAGDGQVMLGAGDHYALAIHNTGRVIANGGEIVAKATDGLIHNEGLMTASIREGDAGSVIVQGPSVLHSGVIRADSHEGNAGYAEVSSDEHTYIVEGGRVSAAGKSGLAEGGEILVHSYNGITHMSEDAVVDVSGGREGGHGGFVEVSGFNQLSFHGKAKLKAYKLGYNHGQLLLDPRNIRIAQFGLPPAGVLGDGVYEFGEPGNLPNDDTVIGVAVLEAIVGDILLQATQSIFVDAEVNLVNNNNVTFEAGNVITVRESINGANSLTFRAFLNGNASRGWVSINVPLEVTDFIDFSGSHIFMLDTTTPGGRGLIRSGGTQTYTGRVELQTDYLFEGSQIVFNDSVDTFNSTNLLQIPGVPPASMLVNGDVVFNDPVGLRNPLADLAINGMTTINPANGYLGNTPDVPVGTNTIITNNFQTFNGPTLLASDVDLVSNDDGDIVFTDTVDGPHDLNVFTGGVTRFEGEVGGNDPLTGLFTDVGGTVEVGADITADEQFYGEMMTLLDDATFTGDTSVEFNDDVNADGNDFIVNSPLTVLSGDVFDADLFQTDAAGETFINGDITANGVDINDVVTLTNDSTITGTDFVDFESTIDGPHNLTVNSEQLIRFGDDIGGMDPLESLTTNGDGSQGLVLFDGRDESMGDLPGPEITVNTTGDINLNPFGRDEVPALATIGSTGPLTLNSADGSIAMGPNEKLTTLGDLNMMATNGNIAIGDLNALGDINVDGNTISITDRPGGEVLNFDGTIVEDEGVDIVATGDVTFSVTPDGTIEFIATENGAISDTLDGIEVRMIDGLSQEDFLLSNLGALQGLGLTNPFGLPVLLDLTAFVDGEPPNPPMTPNDFALAFDEIRPITDRVYLEPFALRPTARLGIYLRSFDNNELLGTTDGISDYTEFSQADDGRGRSVDREGNVLANRLRRNALLDAIDRHTAIFFGSDVALGAGADSPLLAPDGSIILADGTVIPAAGTIVAADGMIITADGTLIEVGGPDVIAVDGIVLADGSVVAADDRVTVLAAPGSIADSLNAVGERVWINADGTIYLNDGTLVTADGDIQLADADTAATRLAEANAHRVADAEAVADQQRAFIRSQLGAAYAAYQAQNAYGDLCSFLQNSDEHNTALWYLHELGEFMQTVDVSGATAFERARIRDTVLCPLTPDGMSCDDLEAATDCDWQPLDEQGEYEDAVDDEMVRRDAGMNPGHAGL